MKNGRDSQRGNTRNTGCNPYKKETQNITKQMELEMNHPELAKKLRVLACLVLGYVLKKSFDRLPNKYIPLILEILGAVVGCFAAKGISLENVVYGALSGLSSTGLHQMFSRLIEKGGKSDTDLVE